MSLVKLDRQEAFNRAWTGLKAQEFRKALQHPDGPCSFLAPNGDRCAWGHVDPKGTQEVSGGLISAQVSSKVNLSIYLDGEDTEWAQGLQLCHDKGHTPDVMKRSLLSFAVLHDLRVPGLPAVEAIRTAVEGAAVLDKGARDRIVAAVLVAL